MSVALLNNKLACIDFVIFLSEGLNSPTKEGVKAQNAYVLEVIGQSVEWTGLRIKINVTWLVRKL